MVAFTDVTEARPRQCRQRQLRGWASRSVTTTTDGYPDLYVTNYGKKHSVSQQWDGTFTTLQRKLALPLAAGPFPRASWDIDNDGHLDLFVTRYMDWDADHNKICGRRLAYVLVLRMFFFPATTNILYRNRGDGTFEGHQRALRHCRKEGKSARSCVRRLDGDASRYFRQQRWHAAVPVPPITVTANVF